jgi:response regulator RpfG family c-di-GMP phosphodiesterase
MKMVKEPVKDQIVAICDIYISLRSFRDYKRRYDQNMTVKALTNDYKQYFDNIVFERFMNFINVFKDMYDEYGG